MSDSKGSLILTTALLAAALSGCQRKVADGKKHIRFCVMGSKQEIDLANGFTRDFEKNNPGIKVDIEPVAGMTYDSKLAMQAAAGTLPDVIMLADSLIPTLQKYHVVENLTPWIAKDASFPSHDIYPQMMETGRGHDGNIYMLPRELGVVAMFYNRTLLRKAGLPDPKADWTYDQMRAMAKKLTLRDAKGRVTQYGFTASYAWAGFYASFLQSFGGSALDYKNQKATFSSPTSLKALQWLVDMVVVDRAGMPPNAVLTAPGIDPFVAGKVAMSMQVFPQVPMLRQSMKGYDWDVQMLPAGPKAHLINMGAAGYGMSASSKNKPEAWLLLKHIVSQQGQRALARSGSGIPTLKSLAHDPCWRPPGLPPRNLDAFVNSVKFGMGWRDILVLTEPEINDAVTMAFEQCFNGISSVTDAFKQCDQRINALFAKRKAAE
ncbi:MAG: ABC transporter substrate-binding protein [Armatimonadota bacterium]